MLPSAAAPADGDGTNPFPYHLLYELCCPMLAASPADGDGTKPFPYHLLYELCCPVLQLLQMVMVQIPSLTISCMSCVAQFYSSYSCVVMVYLVQFLSLPSLV